jgi:hypothetical protein
MDVHLIHVALVSLESYVEGKTQNKKGIFFLHEQ